MTTIDDLNNHFKNETLKRIKSHKASTFQLLTGKTYDARKYNKDRDAASKSTRRTSLRTIKSAPFQINEIKSDDVDETVNEKPFRCLYDNIENASLFSIDSKASLKNYNYTEVYKKFPSLNKHAEDIRRNLFRNYMKTFDETNENFRENEHLYDKTDKKNITTEIRNLIYTFERDATNRAFIESRNKRIRELSAHSAKTVKKEETVKQNEVKVEPIENTPQVALKQPSAEHEASSVHEKIIPRKASEASSNETKIQKHAHKEEKAFNDLTNKMKKINIKSAKSELRNASLKGFEDIFITTSGDALMDDASDTTVDPELNVDNKKLKTHLRPQSPISQEDSSLHHVPTTMSSTSNDFIENEDERYYNRNKQKFIKNTEQAHKSMFNFAKQAAAKQDKRFPKPVEPKLRTIEELNLNDDRLIKQIRLNRLTKLLENADDYNNEVQIKSKLTSSSVNLSTNDDNEDEDYIDDDDDNENDEEFNKQYRISLRKRQHYLKLLKYMYTKAQKNQAKIETLLNKNENSDNVEMLKKEDYFSKSLSTIPQSPLLQLSIGNEAFVSSEPPAKPVFRISIPFRHDNISSYEVFIPRGQYQNNNVASTNDINSTSTSTRSSLSNSNKFYDATVSSNSQVKNLMPLNINSLNGLKVVESKAKSNFWHNYNK